MEKLVLIVHILAALSIIGLILLQQGKGAEAGASFGSGASQTVFGSQGSGNFFSRLTAIMATIFFVTSFGLAVLARQGSDAGVEAELPSIPAVVEQPGDAPAAIIDSGDIPELEQQAPESSELPSIDEEPASEDLPDASSEEGDEQP